MSPTGFTADIIDGISFRQYALHCARAFGALVSMREDSADAPIPTKFKADDYHRKELKKSKAKLALLNKMPIEEAAKEAALEYANAVAERDKAIAKTEDQRAKYLAMLEKVRAYQPPSNEHIEYKKFMESQILSSIDFDYRGDYYKENPIDQLSPEDWKKEQIRHISDSIDYYTKAYAEEVARTKGRNKWLKELFDSLPKE